MFVASAVAVAGVSVCIASADEPPKVDKPVEKPVEKTAAEPFTGTLKLRQERGSLYYRIYLVKGKVIGGYDTWEGHSKHYHQLVGGWYDGDRLVLLVQSTDDAHSDKWFSHEHHFQREGDKLVIKHSLYGFGKTQATGEVYRPHVIDAQAVLPAEEVRRLAELPPPKRTTSGSSESSDLTPEQRLERTEAENLRLRETIAELEAKLKQKK